MRMRLINLGRAGFTLVEVIVVLGVLATAMLVAAPALENFIARSKLEGTSRDLSALIQRARLEAIKRAVPTVVRVDPATGEVFAFADVDGAAATDPPDRLFNPVAGEPPGGTDYALARWTIPETIAVAGPPPQPAIDKLTAVGGDRVILFAINGSVDEVGAYRFADTRGNFLEVRVEPQATARVSVLKWDGTGWWTRGEGGHPWTWN